jgi:hypothetical protein
MDPSDISHGEVERQVTAAVDRYREAVASMDAGGRPEAGQRAAVKAAGRALQLVSFVVKRALDGGVTLERLGELTDWEPALVREVIERPPEPALVKRVAPAGVDSAAVSRAAASFAASERLRALTQEILVDVDDERWSPAAADLDELLDRLERAWRGWRGELRGPME